MLPPRWVALSLGRFAGLTRGELGEENKGVGAGKMSLIRMTPDAILNLSFLLTTMC